MPPFSYKASKQQDIRVFIRDHAGRYLSRRGLTDWQFVQDRNAAVIFFYLTDRVAEQIERLRIMEGITLYEEPVPLAEIYEICDRCKEFIPPFLIHFDGRRFLCSECLSKVRHRPGTERH
jgi:recombinational DNA repair protein (RecF pathway)